MGFDFGVPVIMRNIFLSVSSYYPQSIEVRASSTVNDFNDPENTVLCTIDSTFVSGIKYCVSNEFRYLFLVGIDSDGNHHPV